MASMPYCSAVTHPGRFALLRTNLAPGIFHTEERKSTENFRFITPIFCDDTINHDKSLREDNKATFFSLKRPFDFNSVYTYTDK